MRNFFGFSLSEIAVLGLLIISILPITEAAKAGNYLPLVAGILTYFGASTIKGITYGARILLSLLVAMILVPAPFRGRRFYERFASGSEETEKEEVEPEAEEEQVSGTTEGFAESEAAGAKSDEANEGPEPHDLKGLGDKLLAAEEKKKYRLPSEKDDGEHHMDSGTTFMNAYKQLKPDQIAALTADTQKLISVQKDLMSNLSNLKPLISDGKEIMKTFKSFFGSDPTSA